MLVGPPALRRAPDRPEEPSPMPRALLASIPLLDAKELIKSVGMVGIWAVVFAESGLLVGFFLPGDSLLFTAGFFASAPESVSASLHFPLLPLIIGCAVAAIFGDQ